jgi:hypothetical protein
MLSLKWGDVLSTLLPGAVALFAVAPFFPTLQRRIDQIDALSTLSGIMLLIGAALAGGVLEAFTRIAWEPFWLMRRCKPSDALSGLTADNLELYERGVQSSYKYATFYANFAWATILLLASHLYRQGDLFSIGSALLTLAIGILLTASHIQWKYFVNYQKKVFNKANDRRTYASE